MAHGPVQKVSRIPAVDSVNHQRFSDLLILLLDYRGCYHMAPKKRPWMISNDIQQYVFSVGL